MGTLPGSTALLKCLRTNALGVLLCLLVNDFPLFSRYEAAILMLLLGKDSEACSFIKFWLSKSRVKKVHSKFTETFEDGSFYKGFTKNGQDKREDIFEKLSPQVTKKPFLTDWVFYFCLAIIKKNTKTGLKKNSKDWKKTRRAF